jgi:hypothetical protein
MKGRGPVVPASQPGAPSSPAFVPTGYPSPASSARGIDALRFSVRPTTVTVVPRAKKP